jgi:SsrA-binding protein
MPPNTKKRKPRTGSSGEPTNEFTVASNRRARYDYAIEEIFDAGMVLKGTEVKSLRQGAVSLQEGYISISNGQAYLFSVHIAPYKPASVFNHEPIRTRKLLLNRAELIKLDRFLNNRGFTAVPLRIHFVGGRAKIEFGVGKGRTRYDKRARIAERDAQRQIERHMRRLR